MNVIKKFNKVIYSILENNIHHNYVYDECLSIERNSNAVLSMFYNYIRKNIKEGSDLVLYSDNCAGQNKNQYVINFLIHMTKVEKYFNSIEFKFMTYKIFSRWAFWHY